MLWWLIIAVLTGVAAAALPHRRIHRGLGAASLVATAIGFARSWGHATDGWAPWLVATAMLLAVLLNGMSAVLLFVGTPHGRRRHIVYSGYGVLFTAVAAWWAIAGRHPSGTGAITAAVGTVATYGIGSVAIALYKHRHPVAAPVSPAPAIDPRSIRRQ